MIKNKCKVFFNFNLFTLQTEKDTLNPLELVQAFVLMLWAYAIIGLYCSCGEMVTNGFEIINDELKQCKWYLLPLKIQQMISIFVANAQQPTFIRGFGNIFCTRETFKIVSIKLKCSTFFSKKLKQ